MHPASFCELRNKRLVRDDEEFSFAIKAPKKKRNLSTANLKKHKIR